jgi:hypothetical protein
MKRVVFTPEAQQQLVLRKHWWRENRDKAPALFERELSSAISLLGGESRSVSGVGNRSNCVVRRCLLQKTRTHLYFFVEDAAANVVIVSAWGAVQGRKPRLR